jgi:hypothetical protein
MKSRLCLDSNTENDQLLNDMCILGRVKINTGDVKHWEQGQKKSADVYKMDILRDQGLD